MQKSKDKTSTPSAVEIKKLHKRIAELEESRKRSENLEKVITIQRNLTSELNTTDSYENGLRLCLEAAIKVSGIVAEEIISFLP